jgi:hypothetical protein
LYINGELVAEDDTQTYVPNTTRDLHIGSGTELGNNFRFLGQIDDAALFNTALTQAEIKNIMENGVASLLASLPGDHNKNGVLDVADLNLQADAIVGGQHPEAFDLNSDNLVNYEDRKVWVKTLKMTAIGDANLDGKFGTGDLVAVFSAGKYESGTDATWDQGDFDGDRRFGTGDLVAAFQDGGFDPNAAVSAVPEPATLWLLLLGTLLVPLRCQHKGARFVT